MLEVAAAHGHEPLLLGAVFHTVVFAVLDGAAQLTRGPFDRRFPPS